MLEICASRMNAAGKEEVLVIWRPTWEPVEWVSSGAVWDAWVQEQAAFKARAVRTEGVVAVAKTGAGAEAVVGPGAAVELDAVAGQDAALEQGVAVGRQIVGGRIVALVPGAGKCAMLSLKRPVRVAEKAVSLAVVGTMGTAATGTGMPIKRGRGRPPKAKV